MYTPMSARRRPEIFANQSCIGELFSQRTLEIPYYQRTYDWQNPHFDAFECDIQRIFERDMERGPAAGASHDIGNIALLEHEPGSQKPHDVIDGQQRLTTSALFLAAILHTLEENPVTDHQAMALKLYLGQHLFRNGWTPVVENREPKISHIMPNERQTFEHLVTMGRCDLANPNKNMVQAFKRFKKFLSETYTQHTGEKVRAKDGLPVEYLGHMANIGTMGLNIFAKTTKDPLVAQRMFIDINSKGHALSAVDLVKATFASKICEQDFVLLWQKLADSLTHQEMEDFLTAWLQIRNQGSKPITEKNLFKTFLNLTLSVIPLTRRTLEVFVEDALRYKQHIQHCNAQGSNLDALFWINHCNVKQHRGLLIAAKRMEIEQPDMFALLCEEISKLVLVMTAQTLSTNTIADDWIRWSKEIGSVTTYGELETFLDRTLRATRARMSVDLKNSLKFLGMDATWKNKRPVIKKAQITVLAHFAHKLERDRGEIETAAAFMEKVTLEHIVPIAAKADYSDSMSKETFQREVLQIGNLTLLTDRENKEAGSKSVGEKLRIYESSQITMTRASVRSLSKGRKGRVAEQLRILPQIDERFTLEEATLRSEVLAGLIVSHLNG